MTRIDFTRMFSPRHDFLSIRASLVCLALTCITTGCNSSSDTAQTASVPQGSPASSVNANEPSASVVVSQFLDQVRRGGEDSGAGNLLTTRAQAELKRIGRTVQPIGSPDAHFDVRQARAIPNEANSMLVQSIWTEPNGDGTKSDFEVVWAVQHEAAGWRISGLAMELEAGKPPVVIDFENGEAMARMLADPADSASQNTASSAETGAVGNASQAAISGSDSVAR